jgi:cytochrome b561
MKKIILLGPILFASVLTILTIVEYDFLLSLGWHPINDPTFDWPSGLALGRFGWMMTATFIISGLIMTLFAYRLSLDLKIGTASQLGATLLACAGVALAMLAFTTDPTIRETPSTWHGRLHDLSFVLLGLTLFPAMIVLGFAFRNDDKWKNLSLYTWLTLCLAAPAFALKGAAFYVFLLAILVWNEVVALRLPKP